MYSEEVLETAIRNTGSLPAGTRVGVAVSGGADSMALLIAMHSLARWELTVLHVNHGLRGSESDGDEEFVRDFARKLGIRVLVHSAVLESGNVEAAARRARYSWFRKLLKLGEFDLIATGHTASDQAETVLFRFLRGAGTAGLSGVLPYVEGVVRPLIKVTREDVCHYLQGRGIRWREDSSNRDFSLARNRIRHELLPALVRDWNPGLREVLCQTAEWARAEEEYWSAEARRLALDWVRFEKGAAIVDCGGLTALPLAAARRVIRLVISMVKGDLLGVDFAHVEEIYELAARQSGSGRLRVPGMQARRSFEWLRLSVDEEVCSGYCENLQIPGQISIPNGRSTLELELKSVDSVYNTDEYQLDWRLVTGSLELRNWRPGDYYRQAGHSGEKKLKHLFQKARIPFWERRQWPVITLAGSIVWTRRFGLSAGFAPSADTGTVLVIREKANQNV